MPTVSVDGLVGNLIESAPAAAMVVIVVVLFIRYLRVRDEASERRESKMLAYMEERDTKLAETLRHMGDDCHGVQRRTIEALEANSRALTLALSQLENVK